jgi:hypothetical protein
MHIARRALLRRVAVGGAAVWVAPSILRVDAAGAVPSCPGATSSWSFPATPTPTPYNELGCENTGPGGYRCNEDAAGITTRGPTFMLTDVASHSNLSISFDLVHAGTWDSSGTIEDLFMVHVNGVLVFCFDDIGLAGTTPISIMVANTDCDISFTLTGCSTGADEEWGHGVISVTVT